MAKKLKPVVEEPMEEVEQEEPMEGVEQEVPVETKVPRAQTKIGQGFKKYAQRYGKTGHNGDPVAVAMAAYTKVNGATSMDRLTEIAAANGLTKKLEEDWAKVNVGMKRMNLGNALRGMYNRGEDVTIGDETIPGKSQDNQAA